MNNEKVVIIGLDCAAPWLVFDLFKDDLPNLRRLMEGGMYGDLKSTHPPITVPAWMAMMTGKDTGELGVYGFRNRKSYAYDDLAIANSTAIKFPTIWETLSGAGYRNVILGVPQTYPPKPLNGVLVCSFLTPSKESTYTYPPEIAKELDEIADGNYIIDVENFRTDQKDRILETIILMTKRRFKVFRQFLQSKPWDFAMMVEMGTDRIHHGFWRYFDPGHRLYEKGNRFEHAIRDYYKLCDKLIGEVLEVVPDEAHVFVVSDHGAKRMHGAICVNEWLQREGLLTLKEPPKEKGPLRLHMVDWEKTQVWAEGGYFARVFLNVKGREPQGVVEPGRYEALRDTLIEKFEALGDENGNNINTKAYRPQDLFRECTNIPPDLIVYFGDLDWRSAAQVGGGTVHIFENDTGPDDANHDHQGICILKSNRVPMDRRDRRVNGMNLLDIRPTVLSLFGLPPEGSANGKSLL
jgi:predicted AlkP superfamily phosphohydrolase/phosphomutase